MRGEVILADTVRETKQKENKELHKKDGKLGGSNAQREVVVPVVVEVGVGPWRAMAVSEVSM